VQQRAREPGVAPGEAGAAGDALREPQVGAAGVPGQQQRQQAERDGEIPPPAGLAQRVQGCLATR
jgi:hypothetical protein